MFEGDARSQEDFRSNSSVIFNNKTRLLLVGLVFTLALGYLLYAAFPGNTRYYLTVDEFWADQGNIDGRDVRVVGKLVPDSFQRTPGTTQATFVVYNGGETLNATYDRLPPDLFFNPHSDIVMEGSYGEGDMFHVDRVTVKCPSKFQALNADA